MSESLNSQMSSQQQGEDELGQQYEQTMGDPGSKPGPAGARGPHAAGP